MPSDSPEDAPSEALLSLYDTPFRRPYQAYCVTEASSRPTSPDPLVPKPLRASAPPLWQIAVNADFVETGELEQNNSCIQAAASSPEQHVESVTLRKTGQYSKRQTFLPNREPFHERTGSGKTSNHITRAVTPRGSHSLASSEVIAYDRPPSHPRMRQLEYSKKADIQSVSHKPIEHADRVKTCQRPLPPLPLETVLVKPEPDQKDDEWSGKAYGETCGKSQAQHLLPFTGLSGSSTEALRRYKPTGYPIPPRPLPDPPVEVQSSLWSRGTTLEERTTPLSSTKQLYDIVVHESSQPPWKHDVVVDYVQNPSLAGLHVSCGHWGDTNDDTRVPQQTRKELASLQYQLAQLPSQHSALPPLLSIQPDSCIQSVHFAANFAPSIYSSSYIQNGPRPPPWGSYDDLEIKRRQRGDARERARVCPSRSIADSTSTYQKSISSDSLSKDLSREVEEYREQILGVYPDMEFNGDAGSGNWEWYCCVVM